MNKIGFILDSIKTVQFATIEKNLGETSDINLSTKLGFGIHEKSKILAVSANFSFNNNDLPFLLIEIECQFKIALNSWNSFVNKQKKEIVVPQFFLMHLCVLTVGTSRGVLHAKTENTKFNTFFLPTIDLTPTLNTDMIFPLEK